MANIIQAVGNSTNGNIFPPEQRYMLLASSGTFLTVSGFQTGWAPAGTQNGLNSGDIIRVTQSIGHAGKNMTVTIVGSGLGLCLEVGARKMIYTRRQDPTHELFQWAELGFNNMTTGQEVASSNPMIPFYQFGAGTVQWPGHIAIDNVLIQTNPALGGSFQIIIS